MKKKTNEELSHSLLVALVGLAAVGLYAFSRELPAFRRYLRIRRM